MHDHAADDALLAVFKQLGVDLQKPRELNFHFAFPTETDAALRSLAQNKIEAGRRSRHA